MERDPVSFYLGEHMLKIPNKVDDILRKKEDAETLSALRQALHPLGYRDIAVEKRWDKATGMRIGISITWPGYSVPELLVLTMMLPDFEEWLKSKCLHMPKVVGWLCNAENPNSSIGRVLKSNGIHYTIGNSSQNFSPKMPGDQVTDGPALPYHRKMDID